MHMSDHEQPVQVLDAYRDAVRAKDVDAFVDLYADDVRVFDMWGRWTYDGADEWRGMVGEWFGSLGDEQVAVEFDEVRTTVADGVGVLHAFVTYRGLSAQGEELRAMQNRLTCVLERGADGTWRIVHEHSSAPADFETAKVMLRR
jgi:uncharacterized protein (TIGR02246 family)